MNHEEITTNAVSAFYEKFPYPSYPLFAGLRWQEGYLGASHFAAKLYEAQNPGARSAIKTAPQILLAGCGEALPYILRKMEPRSHTLTCVDLSRRSIRRARVRLLTSIKPTQLVDADLKDFLLTRPSARYAHIDSYGVLHHMPHPTAMLALLSERLLPHGTCRFMVYNDPARTWLRHITRALKLLKLEAHRAEDRALALQLFQQMQTHSPSIKERFAGMGPDTFKNTARFVDTFFHAWEIRKSITEWFEILSSVGLVPIGIVDRYAELDDLANPLWQCPSDWALQERGLDRRFENNLEIYCAKWGAIVDGGARSTRTYSNSHLWALRRVTPPKRWFSYLETHGISLLHREQIWLHHINHVHGQNNSRLDKLCRQYPMETLQRLARVGAILPGQIHADELRADLLRPMSESVDTPDALDRVDFGTTSVSVTVHAIMNRKSIEGIHKAEHILRRLNQAQL